MKFRSRFLKTILLIPALCMSPSYAAMQSGWELSTSYIWRLNDDSDFVFTKGSPAKILQMDRTIRHRQAVLNVVQSLTKKFSFRVGCMYQSQTPALGLDLTTLDIGIRDLERGFVYARVIVDSGQEYSLRGEIIPPARIIFAPLTAAQEKKLSDLFLQISEGGHLKIAVLQGENTDPRIYKIPLEGFFDISKTVLDDCKNLSSLAKDHRGPVALLPDYISREPKGLAPKDYSVKPKPGSDGLTATEDEDDGSIEPVSEPEKKKEPEPEPEPTIKPFEPGGGAASIGEDGKPIMTTEEKSEESNLGTAKSMQIGDDGKPVSQ
ncbi:hypothetical protein SAMN02910357_01024 [Succinivibrio dextrinosolvens]|uniref:hypothetical protein n=1 Tax=Succinivibrio dextrinosolvens TaxID=83771 RepID=UPI0008E1150A|nr:hypothetical protein [Succinivibrio dextrinosolvens]SFS48905.1 hypothetical protein SAMN02910357_01024 [Succinivibrio dextrinosolvens]